MPLDLDRPLPEEPGWPEDAGAGPVVALIDAATGLEQRMLAAWVERHRPADTAVDLIRITPSRRRRPGQRTDPALTARLGRGDDPYVFPVRVAWFPPEREGRRTARWIDILKFGDPRDPDAIRQYVVLDRFPDRVRIVSGAGAGSAALLAAHAKSVEVLSPAEFVARRAHRALDRAERALRGNRYKVPRLVHDDILSNAVFRDGVMRVAGESGLPVELAFARARYYLREIAATHSPFLIDLIANAIHWIYRQGYGGIIYDPEDLRSISTLGEDHPIAFVPSHRSNLDRLSLQYLLWENDLPPNHTAAGINMNFFPVGPLIRRTGAFFIRRSFKENELYKFVLRSYLDYLIEKRFPLEWYMEGGRSRTGKLLPPRYGMLTWVVDAVRRGKADDLFLIPTSIAYDQIQDVADYADEVRGGGKRKESFGWAFKTIRSLRRRYGNIHVRFAEPLSIAKELAEHQPAEGSIDLQKLAFEVMYRIGRITPITPTAVVSIALLAARGARSTDGEVAVRAAGIDALIERRRLPVTEPIRLEHPAETRRVLDQLVAHGSVSVAQDGPVRRFWLTGHQALQAAYYRNTIVHFFVPGAIAELALLLGDGSADGVWREVARLRDLLKFEFFFSEKERFRAEIEAELEEIDGDWERRTTDPAGLLAGHRPLRAHWAVLPFFEAYQIVAEELSAGGTPGDDKAFFRGCLERGTTARAEGRLVSDEAVSQALFATGLQLARNLGLTDEPDEREAFTAEIERIRSAALVVAGLA